MNDLEIAPIDAARALELLELAVAERGADYVYTVPKGSGGCVYTANGKPSCMVAVALVKHGIPLERFGFYSNYITGLARELLPTVITEPAAWVLDAAQRRQDKGETWGAALDAARRFVSNSGIGA